MSLEEKIKLVLTKLNEVEDKIDAFNERVATFEVNTKADSAGLYNFMEKVRQFEIFQIKF